MRLEKIRNFCIIAHIDHGKSTLADRFMEITGAIPKLGPKQKQFLDSLELEKERGITVKLKAIRLFYGPYQLNLIDTPGHVDFGYEVSRALAACEGAILLIDATQGVQAQTIVNLEKARSQDLTIIPAINKIDLPSANVEETVKQILGLDFKEDEIVKVSAKTGLGVENLLNRIIQVIPGPAESYLSQSLGASDPNSAALVFDSYYDDHKGVVAFVRLFSGKLSKDDTIRFISSKAETNLRRLGYMSPKETFVESLSAGEVGFIVTGLKDVSMVRVGDTVTLQGQFPNPIVGYKKPVPTVFLSLYPLDNSKYLRLREAMEKLSLSDAAFTFQPESIGALGKGFRCGFLGLLHADIIKERIEREFDVSVISASPSVLYKVETTKNETVEVKSASEYPDQSIVKMVKEPWAKVSIYTPREYMSKIMDLCQKRRAILTDIEYLEEKRIRINYEMPLVEIIVGFYGILKSITSGYASLDYEVTSYRKASVSKLEVLVAGDLVPHLGQLVLKEKAQEEAKRIVKKLKNLIPRQQFKVSLQAVVGGKVLAREDIPPVRKDVTGHLYGGDVTRKKKLLEKQKRGKKRMRRFGKVDIPPAVFWEVMAK